MKKQTRILLAVLLGLVLIGVVVFILPNACGTAHQMNSHKTTSGQTSEPAGTHKDTVTFPQEAPAALARNGWLEMPGTDRTQEQGMACHTHWAEMGGKQQRNYTLLYDTGTYASCWVAYPLCADHLSNGREEAWGYDPLVDKSQQTAVTKGYGGTFATPNYSRNFYARGHQIPNADRSGVPEMMAQTYYSTNMTPQIQNGFNGGIWAKLEAGVRGSLTTDTLYVVTGATFHKVSSARANAVNPTVTNRNDGKVLPVPKWYWKVLLKVKRSAEGQVEQAETIGFWLPHEDLKGHSYTEYVTTVDQIEEWTGFDFFVNLKDSLENAVENQCDWAAFQTF